MGLLTYMQSGRFKVTSHLSEWFGEFRDYYRKDGVIVKEADDLMAATRYAFMMRRRDLGEGVIAQLGCLLEQPLG